MAIFWETSSSDNSLKAEYFDPSFGIQTIRSLMAQRIEDALQEAYLAAYRGIIKFRGTATVLTWLTRIVINQALGRLRAQRRNELKTLARKVGRPLEELTEIAAYLTQEEISQMVLARRERVSSALNELRRRGLVRYSMRGN